MKMYLVQDLYCKLVLFVIEIFEIKLKKKKEEEKRNLHDSF